MLGFRPISSLPISGFHVESVFQVSGGATFTIEESFEAKIYAATAEYITLGTDTIRNQPFLGTLMQTMRFDRTIIGGRGFTQMALGIAEIELLNAEADYDYLDVNYAVDGQELLIKVGDPEGAYDDFFTLAKITATGFKIGSDKATIQARDNSYRLEVPALVNVYQGTGDMEGGAELKDKRKQKVYGPSKNITPTPIIPSEGVFQANDGPVSAIPKVYDTGYQLVGPIADWSTLGTLRAAAIPDGSYATCLALGIFRLGGGAFGQVTCDVDGDATGGYVVTTAEIVLRIILNATDIDNFTEIDTLSLSNLYMDQPAPISYVIELDSDKTVAECVEELMEGAGGTSGFTRTGRFQAHLFEAPEGSPVAEYDEVDILELTREELPSSVYPPAWRQRAIFNRNWTVIENPASGVVEFDPDYKTFLGNPYSVISTDLTLADGVLENHPMAQDPTLIESYFANEADALAEANRQFDLYYSGYGLYRIVVKDHPFTHDIIQCVRVLSWPRLGIQNRLFRIAAISDDAREDKVTLMVFG
jgi:hypothetical protein